ncbi:hypothetical protein BN946_scf184815.g23 [Trametes cinnabarina]|uniref:HECT-type E3 ubiquitin transferase n=1 Tax=Pycnoporus cinnabarinus TaxID=5643 RepID=A0A060S2K7_PYCCI|nr:hypothetical protein BN946_scf184815.g23 [Trametes cinnabarina]
MDSTQSRAATSSSILNSAHTEEQPQATPSDSKVLRTSARVKAAKQKEKQKERSSAESQQPSSSSSKRVRDSSSHKGKGKEVADESRANKRARRSTFPVASSLTINESTKDSKGKKRAAPEDHSDDDTTAAATSASKKLRRPTSAYSLRPRTDNLATSDMTRKTRPTTGKGKVAARSKSLMNSAGSSRAGDDDVDMVDAECIHGEGEPHDERHDEGDDHDDLDDDGGGGLDDEDDEDEADGDFAGSLGGMGNEASAISIFGDYRQLGSYMMGISGRLKTMLNNIKPTADPTTRLVTLQELSELLSISTEDTLAGSFQVEAFIRELVRILGGTGNDEDEGDDDDIGEQDEDAALAAALAMSTGGGAYQGDENLEAQVLACRCLANLMEALPGVAHTVVYHGAIPVLCSKLIEISYIDLAEQTLSTLEKISEEFPSSIVREGGLAALLNYLDFFSIAVQRTALQAAANCCRNVSVEHFSMIRAVWPIIRNCLGYSDQRLVEFACLCVIRIIDSYYRASPENLEALVDADLIRAVNMLLLPAGGSPLIAASTYTLLLRALATCARVSPKITLVLLEAGIVDTLYQILTGVLPPASDGVEEQGDAAGGQGLGGGLADMTVMENLGHRPKDQIEEALSLVSELMPPLPKGLTDGVFDHKCYTEKVLHKMVKAKAKAERAAARQAAAAASAAQAGTSGSVTRASASAPIPTVTEEHKAPEAMQIDPPTAQGGEEALPPLDKEPMVVDRTELLRSNPGVVGRFLRLIIPILVDVYAASVNTPVRVRTLTGLLKAVSFLSGEELKQVFSFVPIASFASSILSSKDHPSLVIGALQLVELLLAKVPTEYKPVFRREGVFHEIESLASRPIASTKTKDKGAAEKDISEAPSPADTGINIGMPVSISVISTMPYKKLSSLTMEPDDAITLRARIIRFKHLASDDAAGSDDLFMNLRRLVDRINDPALPDKDLSAALMELAALFGSQHTSVSSFELLQSGVIDGLLRFFANAEHQISLSRRQEIFFTAFTSRKSKAAGGQTPLAVFVKKLQESLTRMEPFEVISIAQNADDSKRSSPSLLARQLRLRLVAADDADTPRTLNNIVVSIHAIATFQALHDYLRPRVAALAASGLTPPSSRFGLAEQLARASESAAAAPASTPGVNRRRSLRLSAQQKASADPAAEPSGEPSEATASGALESASTKDVSSVAEGESIASVAEPAPSETVVNDDEFTADFTDDEVDVDAEVIDDEDPDNSISDKTINVSVGEDGSKVEAQTPDGTHIPTPGSSRGHFSSTPTPRMSTPKTSYAAALKAKPSDWHLEFSMDDHQLPLDLTVYGAIHQHEMRKHRSSGSPFIPSMIWQGVYSIKFKKVPGPVPSSDARADETGLRSRAPSPSLSSLPDDAPHAKILKLLRVLHRINSQESEWATPATAKRILASSAFVNNKLTAKLTRQLEEPMIVASSCLPDWALDLPQHFPFLFPFATRYNFLQSTSFGYARLILKWQSQQSRGQDSSRRDDGVGFLGRLQRQKVRISRKHILESAVKVFELYGSSSSILEVEYFEEVGTGLGPTLEFYSLVSKEFARRDLKIWRDADPTAPGAYVHHPLGLFPAPISPEEIAKDGGQKRTHIIRVIGQFVAKAMLDSRIIDLSFNKVFLKLVLGEEVPLTLESLKRVDPELAASLLKIQNLAAASKKQDEKLRRKLAAIEDMGGVSIEDLGLDFTVPGYDIELRPGGRDIPVTADNVDEYIQEVVDAIIGKGAQTQAQAFREGFSKVFPIGDLQAFTSDELAMLFGNAEEDWSVETLSEALKADHGFNVESRAIRDLIEIMSEYDGPTRRSYLQFITGSPKLPIGGFKGLNPPLTVVRKPHEAPLTADDYLPSVMTCVNYLKLPEYSSKAVMKEKLSVAMREGVGSFHLS